MFGLFFFSISQFHRLQTPTSTEKDVFSYSWRGRFMKVELSCGSDKWLLSWCSAICWFGVFLFRDLQQGMARSQLLPLLLHWLVSQWCCCLPESCVGVLEDTKYWYWITQDKCAQRRMLCERKAWSRGSHRSVVPNLDMDVIITVLLTQCN